MKDEAVDTFVYKQFLDHVIGPLGSLSTQYQPVIDLTTGRVEYYEALLRISSSHLGPIYPASFLLLMDQLGVMKETTHWVIDHAMRDLDNMAGTTVFVNLAPEFIGDLTVIDYALEALNRSRTGPESLGLEVAYDALLRRGRGAIEWLKRAQAAGVPVTIDRCSYRDILRPELAELPSSYAKFVLTPGASILDAEVREFAAATARLTEAGRHPIALGIEDEQALEAVRRAGFRFGQGFLLGYPVGGSELAAPAAE